VWQAAQWPHDFADPLCDDFSESEIRKLIVLFRGVYEFLEFKKQKRS
jgi:hypothetical protein